MWTCQRCTVQNQHSSSVCEVCNFARDTPADSSDWWQCPHCCQFNKIGSGQCSVCDLSAHLVVQRPVTEGEGVGTGSGRGAPRQRGTSVDELDALGSGPSDVDPQQSDTGSDWVWVCQKKYGSAVCNTSNDLNVYRCGKCNAVKPYLQHQLSLCEIPRSKNTSSGSAGPASFPIQAQDMTPYIPPTEPSSVPQPARVKEAFTDREFEDITSASFERLQLGSGDPFEVQDDEVLDFPDAECRLVLVGKTGNGKSATANTILGLEGRFKASYQFASTTKHCQRYNNVRFGIRVEVVDTPGVFDTHSDKDKIAKEIIKCLGVVAPGPHAIILVLRFGVRFTEEENKAVEEVNKLFGVQLLRFLVIVFTHGDSLGDLPEDQKEEELKAMLEDSPPKLRELLDRANHRYVVFSNKASVASKRQQVKQLLTTITRLLKVNGGRPYTNEMLRIAEECMQERETELVQGMYGRRRRGSEHTLSTQRNQCRDIARDEVVQEAPLFQRIWGKVFPMLKPMLELAISILVGAVIKKICRVQ